MGQLEIAICDFKLGWRNNDAKFKVVFDAIRQLMLPASETERQRIGFREKWEHLVPLMDQRSARFRGIRVCIRELNHRHAGPHC